MAYISQDDKKRLVALAKPILKKYGVKATFGVRNHSTLVCNISSSKIDFIGSYIKAVGPEVSEYVRQHQYLDVNHYHINNYFEGEARMFLNELKAAMMDGNHDNSEPQYDYFDVGWYIDINIGKWNKPYRLTE